MKTKNQQCITLIIIAFTLFLLGSGLRRQSEPIVTAGMTAAQDVPEGWISLFDGKTLNGWKVVRYGGNGEPYVRNGAMVIPVATTGPMTGLCWVGDSLPVNNYVIYYEARRVTGRDIFAGLTFPYGETAASLVFGGWGGMVNGLSCIDGYDALENETTQFFSLSNHQWYPVQLRVTADSINATVGAMQIVELATAGKDIHLRDEILNTGLTLWTYDSTGEIRNLRLKKIP